MLLLTLAAGLAAAHPPSKPIQIADCRYTIPAAARSRDKAKKLRAPRPCLPAVAA